MSNESLIRDTEVFVREAFRDQDGVLLIAHDFDHVDRVRNTALRIARLEQFTELEKLEITALLHDIGLTRISDQVDRTEHGAAGAKVADKYLRKNSDYTEKDIGQIVAAIKYHSLPPWVVRDYLETLREGRNLIEILRDADLIDGLGTIGILRAASSKYFLPLRLEDDTAEMSREEIAKRYGGVRPPVRSIIDQINQCRYNVNNLHTESARQIAEPLLGVMRDFVRQFLEEAEETNDDR